jgi:hypothetical protein
VVVERSERRGMPRVDGKALRATVSFGEEPVLATLTDVSTGGTRVRLAQPIAGLTRHRDGVLRVALPERDTSAETELVVPVRVANLGRDTAGRFLGLGFADESGDRYRLVAALQFADINKLEAVRATRHGRRFMPLVLARFTVWSFAQALRGMLFAVFRRSGGKKPAAKAAT